MSAPPAPSGEDRAPRGPPAWLIGLLLAIFAARLALAAGLHLSEDEAYYRLWAQAPALGYYDHPPMIAWWIAAGVSLVGDSPLGVRLLPVAGVFAASLLVHDMARLVGANASAATRATVWFNAAPLVAVGGFLAVPDAPAALFWCLTLWSLLKAGAEGGIGWWLAAGAAAGLATLSKYSALFLGPGVLVWLAATPRGRALLATPGPWMALLVAAALFGLNLAWNAAHGWLTFAKQFGRIAPHALAPRYLVELIVVQALLLNPFVAAALVIGLRGGGPLTRSRAWPFVATSAPFLGYLILHALHDRVQPHWPAPVYPALALVGALAAGGDGVMARRLRQGAPAAAVIVVLGLLALIALPTRFFAHGGDLMAPLRGWSAFARRIDAARVAAGGAWIGTTSYGLAAELADSDPRAPIVQIAERDRWRGPASGMRPDLERPGLVVDLTRRLDPDALRRCFARVEALGVAGRGAAGERPKVYGLYRVEGPRRAVLRDGCW